MLCITKMLKCNINITLNKVTYIILIASRIKHYSNIGAECYFNINVNIALMLYYNISK